MTSTSKALERLFHEPSRLAIVSELAGVTAGRSFGQLKETCELTDGNLSRHLKLLAEEGVVEIEKSFVEAKPLTTVYLTDEGRERFLEYLSTLEDVLKEASKRARPVRRRRGVTARALKTTS